MTNKEIVSNLKSLLNAVEATMREFKGSPDTFRLGADRAEALRIAIEKFNDEEADNQDT